VRLCGSSTVTQSPRFLRGGLEGEEKNQFQEGGDCGVVGREYSVVVVAVEIMFGGYLIADLILFGGPS
jgi:hypothetical protein